MKHGNTQNKKRNRTDRKQQKTKNKTKNNMVHTKHIRTNRNTVDVKNSHTKVQTIVFETQASHTTIKTNVFHRVISRNLLKHIVCQARDPRTNVKNDSSMNRQMDNYKNKLIIP